MCPESPNSEEKKKNGPIPNRSIASGISGNWEEGGETWSVPFISLVARKALYSQVALRPRPIERANRDDRWSDQPKRGTVQVRNRWGEGKSRALPAGSSATGTSSTRELIYYVPIPDSAPAAAAPPPAEGRAPPCFQLSLTASNIFTCR